MIRETILKECERLKWSHYRLIQEAGVKPGPVYRFLSGERDAKCATIEPLLKCLGLKLTGGTHGKH